MIRKATEDDWDAISDISRRSGYVDYINRTGPVYMKEGETFVYCDPDVIAFAKLQYLPDNAVWFSGLRVDPNYWGKGIGTILTAKLMQEARNRQFSIFRALVYTDNLRSLKLFEKLGSVCVGTYDFYAGIPDVSGMNHNRINISGYINYDWKFTKVPENSEIDMFTRESWEVVKPTPRTVQILKTGHGTLKLQSTEGFTCLKKDNFMETGKIFKENTEKSSGHLLEIPLK